MLNIILYITAMLSFFSYISFIWIKYGAQETISASYYILPKKHNFLFFFFCIFFAIPTMILCSNILVFLAGSAIAFVGTASAFRDSKMENNVHNISAYTGAFLGQTSIFLDFHLWYLNIIVISIALLIFLLRKYIKKYTWYIEILAFLSIGVAMLTLL
jgi:hypothetical protein